MSVSKIASETEISGDARDFAERAALITICQNFEITLEFRDKEVSYMNGLLAKCGTLGQLLDYKQKLKIRNPEKPTPLEEITQQYCEVYYETCCREMGTIPSLVRTASDLARQGAGR